MPNSKEPKESRIQDAVHEVYDRIVNEGLEDEKLITAEIKAAAKRHKVPAKDVRAELEILIEEVKG
jgi:hypothetical protein